MKEHEKVAIKIISLDEWQSRFNHVIKKVHNESSRHSYDEIESDVFNAIKEIREEKR